MSVMPVIVDPKNGTMDEAGRIISRPCVTYRPLYRNWCIPSKEWQRVYLESLRVKWRYHTTDFRLMQRCVDLYKRVMS